MAFFKKYWTLIIIVLLGLIPLVWYDRGMIIAGGDNYTYINPSAHYGNQFFSWYDRLDAGVPNTDKPKVFPFTAFWFIGGKAGISLLNLQRLWTILHFIFPGLFIFLLIKNIFYGREKGRGDIAGMTGAVLYMFNYLVIVDAFQVVQRPVLTFLPLMLYFWIKGLQANKFSFYYSALFALTSLFFASSNINFPSVSIIYLILFVYLIFHLLIYKGIKKALLFSFVSFLLLFLVNLWWETDFYFSFVKASKSIIAAVREYDFLLSTPIVESFRTMGFWAFRTVFKDKPLVPFSDNYYQLPLLLLTFLIPILSFGSLLFSENKNKDADKLKYFFAFLAFLGIFLSKGANSPFGSFYQFLYDHFPPFSSFREPFAKFTLITVFSFSVLIGLFTESLFNYFEKQKMWFSKLLPAGVILIILFSYYPLLTGKHIQDETWYKDARYSLYVKMPDYWKEIGNWFYLNDPQGRVMVFPKNFYGQTYNWESGVATSGSMAIPMLPNSLIVHSPRVSVNEENRLSAVAYKMLYLGEQANLFPYLNLLNVRWILQQNDATPHNEVGTFDPLIMKKILDSQKYLISQATFGKLQVISADGSNQNKTESQMEALKIYSFLKDSPEKNVYSPTKMYYISGKLENFPDIFSIFPYESDSGYFFAEDQWEPVDLGRQFFSNNLINLKDKKLVGKSSEGESTYKFEIFKKADYFLLINSYLINNANAADLTSYYVKLDGNKFTIPKVSEGWLGIKIGRIDSGSFSLQTNLPVDLIKPEYLTSPFWIVENNGDIKTSSIARAEILSVEKINPSRFMVKLKNPKNAFALILNEAYNPEWKIYFKNRPVKIRHFIINGYANGWLFEKNDFSDVEDIIDLQLYFQPQKYSNTGTIIAVVTILLLMIFIFLFKVRFIKNKNE